MEINISISILIYKCFVFIWGRNRVIFGKNRLKYAEYQKKKPEIINADKIGINLQEKMMITFIRCKKSIARPIEADYHIIKAILAYTLRGYQPRAAKLYSRKKELE